VAVSVEAGGVKWKPRSGCRVDAVEFAAAHRRMCELLDEREWNPWNREAIDAELVRVDTIVDQWTRAEEGFRQYNAEELEAHLARSRERAAEDRARLGREREARVPHYDEKTAKARLAWLEKQASLERLRPLQATGLANKRFPDLAERIPELQHVVAQLGEQFGDPEQVVDADGWLPQERRERMHQEFRQWRRGMVEELIEQIGEQTAAKTRADGRVEKIRIGEKLAELTSRRDTLIAIPRPRVEEMCSECPRPRAWHTTLCHGVLVLFGAGPCPAGPMWSARIRRARRMLVDTAPGRGLPARPVPQPLAVIPSGLALDEVITRLEEIRRQYPEAKVKRGNRSRWEIWPSDPR
jgi:hypothetical protein